MSDPGRKSGGAHDNPALDMESEGAHGSRNKLNEPQYENVERRRDILADDIRGSRDSVHRESPDRKFRGSRESMQQGSPALMNKNFRGSQEYVQRGSPALRDKNYRGSGELVARGSPALRDRNFRGSRDSMNRGSPALRDKNRPRTEKDRSERDRERHREPGDRAKRDTDHRDSSNRNREREHKNRQDNAKEPLDNGRRYKKHQTSSSHMESKHKSKSKRQRTPQATPEEIAALAKEPETDTCGLPVCCNNIKVFCAFIAAIFLLHGAISQYTVDILPQLGRRYPINHTELEFVTGVEKIGFIVTLLFAAFFGNRMNKVSAISSGSFLTAIGSILMATPYFIYGLRPDETPSGISEYARAGLCQPFVKTNASFQESQCELLVYDQDSTGPFSLFCIAQFIIGIGAALYASLALVYLEDNSKAKESPLMIGKQSCEQQHVNWAISLQKLRDVVQKETFLSLGFLK